MTVDRTNTQIILKAVLEEILLRCKMEEPDSHFKVQPLQRNLANSLELVFEEDFAMAAKYVVARNVVEFDILWRADNRTKGVMFVLSVGKWEHVPFHNLMVKMAAREYIEVLFTKSPVFKELMGRTVSNVDFLFRDVYARPDLKPWSTRS